MRRPKFARQDGQRNVRTEGSPPSSTLASPDRRSAAKQHSAHAERALEHAAQTVRGLHQTLVDHTFHAWNQLPGCEAPARYMRGAHDALSAGVYSSIRQGGGALLALLGMTDVYALSAASPPMPETTTFMQNVITMAPAMAFHHEGRPLPLEAMADGSGRLCVFVHGLGCDEESWRLYGESAWGRPGLHYGSLLADERGYTPLYVRYHTGLQLAENGRQLAALIDDLFKTLPVPPTEVVLVGHSLGGLVARAACEHAAEHGQHWLGSVRLVACLGTPHDNARAVPALPEGVALRFVAANLADDSDRPLGRMAGRLLGEVFGDGLVTLSSASGAGVAGDVEAVTIHGLSHMQLLNDPRVFRQLLHWLDEKA